MVVMRVRSLTIWQRPQCRMASSSPATGSPITSGPVGAGTAAGGGRKTTPPWPRKAAMALRPPVPRNQLTKRSALS